MGTQKSPSNVFVVGDDCQSIYSFRGSDIQIILNFEQDFPEARVIKLEQNYRSTKTVVSAGNSVIKNNKRQKQKTLFTSNNTGDPIKHFEALSGEDEALFVAKEIQRLVLTKQAKYGEIAILYRTNFLSRGFEQELIKARIPYTIVGGLQFYDRAEVKDTIAYLKVIANPRDDMAMKRVLDSFPGIGKTTMSKLDEEAARNDEPISTTLKNFKAKMKKTQDAIDVLRQVLQELYLIYSVSKTEDRKDCVSKMMEIVWKRTAIKEALQTKGDKDAFNRLENLDELYNVALHYEKNTLAPTLENFLEGIILQSDADKEADGRSVSLMTVHASKGLEFPVVFVVGMEEGIFPHKNCMGSAEEIEEERRLAYVAVTRAKEKLYLTNTKYRKSYNGAEFPMVSRFLDEIPSELIRRI